MRHSIIPVAVKATASTPHSTAAAHLSARLRRRGSTATTIATDIIATITVPPKVFADRSKIAVTLGPVTRNVTASATAAPMATAHRRTALSRQR